MKITHWIIIFLIFITILLQGLLVFRESYPSYESFEGIRQVEHVLSTGKVIFQDTLSYQGRIKTNGILFDYVAALVSLLIPTLIVFKYGWIILYALIIWITYLISRRLYNDRWIAVMVSGLMALSPTIFATYLHTFSNESLFILVYVLLLFTIFDIEKRSGMLFVILMVIAILMSAATWVVLLGLIAYFILLKIESLPVKKHEIEVFIFSSVFALWLNLILFKKLFVQSGFGALWSGIPAEILVTKFPGLSPALIIASIGVVPLILGIYGMYSSLFEERKRHIMLLSSITIVILISMWLGFVDVVLGFFLATFNVIIISGYTLLRVKKYFKKTVIVKLKWVAVIVMILLTIINFVPVLFVDANTPSQDEIDTLLALRQITPYGSTILGNIVEGYLISAVASRKNFYDENFLQAPDTQRRYDDAKTIFLSQSQTTVLSKLSSNHITYVYLSPLTKSQYSTRLFAESNCFAPIFQTNTTEVYELVCSVTR